MTAVHAADVPWDPGSRQHPLALTDPLNTKAEIRSQKSDHTLRKNQTQKGTSWKARFLGRRGHGGCGLPWGHHRAPPGPARARECQARAVESHRRRRLGRKRSCAATYRLARTVPGTSHTRQLCPHARGPPSWPARPPEPSQPLVWLKERTPVFPRPAASVRRQLSRRTPGTLDDREVGVRPCGPCTGREPQCSDRDEGPRYCDLFRQ